MTTPWATETPVHIGEAWEYHDKVLVFGTPPVCPDEWPDDDPRRHDCDAMGCGSVDHVLMRFPKSDDARVVARHDDVLREVDEAFDKLRSLPLVDESQIALFMIWMIGHHQKIKDALAERPLNGLMQPTCCSCNNSMLAPSPGCRFPGNHPAPESSPKMEDQPRIRVLDGCRHSLARMTEWADSGACPICLTAMAGMLREALTAVMKESVNGRKVADGISLSARQQVENVLKSDYAPEEHCP